MLVYPSVKLKPVKGDPLRPDGDLGQVRSHLVVKAVAVHAEIERCVPEPDQSGQQWGIGLKGAHGVCLASRSVTKGAQPRWDLTVTRPA